MTRVDYAIAGGGLQAGLLALAIRAAQPTAKLAIVERGPTLGGNHTWSFHAADIPPNATWVDQLVVSRWADHEVVFPKGRRLLNASYVSTTSTRMAECVTPIVDELVLNETATEIAADHITTANRRIDATVVIDTRGPDRFVDTSQVQMGWQIFVGQEVLVPDHGITRPMIMDATVPQRDAFTFMYVLPFDKDRLLLEDTSLANKAHLDVAASRAAITDYARAHELKIERVLREESGVLPLPCEGEPPIQTASPLVAGFAGGWFHPGTGYSFPVAARLAALVASLPADKLFGPQLAAYAKEHRSQYAFAAKLNKMLFNWFQPPERYHVLEKFYVDKGHPEPVILRFYALQLTGMDRTRFFLGRPPKGLDWKAALGFGKKS